MFHWICPECGREIPPSVRECQACDPNAVPTSAVEPVETARVAETPSAVEPVVEAVPVPEVVALEPESAAAAPVAVEQGPEQLPLLEVVDSAPVVTPPVAEPEPEPVVETVAPVVETAAAVEAVPVVNEAAPDASPVVESAAAPEPAPAADLKPEPEAVPEPPATALPVEVHELPDPFLALAEEIRAAQAARAASLSEANGLLGLAQAVGTSHSEPDAPAEPAVERPVEPVVSAAPAPVASPSAEAVAPVEATTAIALLEPPQHEIALLPAPEPVGVGHIEAEPVAAAPIELQPVALAPEPQALPEQVSEPTPQQPSEPEGPTLPFAPMQHYTPATSRSIQPVPPRAQILCADSGPRITLPGPTLPPELTRLQDANVVTLIGEPTAQRAKEAIAPKKSGGAPGWLVSLLVMLLLLAAGLGVVFYLLPRTVADAKPGPTPAQAATTTASAGSSSPLAKFIEVTGFRIVTSTADATKKPEVQYLVVNHSAADISDANIFITLRSVKPGLPPVCRFSFKVPSLAPYESKEMSSPIEKTARTVSLPDWQDLRADVQISQ